MRPCLQRREGFAWRAAFHHRCAKTISSPRQIALHTRIFQPAHEGLLASDSPGSEAQVIRPWPGGWMKGAALGLPQLCGVPLGSPRAGWASSQADGIRVPRMKMRSLPPPEHACQQNSFLLFIAFETHADLVKIVSARCD